MVVCGTSTTGNVRRPKGWHGWLGPGEGGMNRLCGHYLSLLRGSVYRSC